MRLLGLHQDGSIREPDAFIGLTDTITRNCFLDVIKKENRQADLPSRLEPDDPPSDPDVLVDLWHALQDLPRELREVVEAIYLQGRSYEEAAKLLGIPEGTLRRRRTQGIRVLREKMGFRTAQEPLSEAELKELLRKIRDDDDDRTPGDEGGSS